MTGDLRPDRGTGDWLSQLPVADFYQLAGTALYCRPADRRYTHWLLRRLGWQQRELLHDIWLALRRGKPLPHVAYATAVFNQSRWARSRLYVSQRQQLAATHNMQTWEPDQQQPDLSPEPLSQLLQTERIGLVRQLLRGLTYRQRLVLQMVYGLGDGFGYSLSQIGHVLSVSPERVRQLRDRGLRRLQCMITHRRWLGLLPGQVRVPETQWRRFEDYLADRGWAYAYSGSQRVTTTQRRRYIEYLRCELVRELQAVWSPAADGVFRAVVIGEGGDWRPDVGTVWCPYGAGCRFSQPPRFRFVLAEQPRVRYAAQLAIAKEDLPQSVWEEVQ